MTDWRRLLDTAGPPAGDRRGHAAARHRVLALGRRLAADAAVPGTARRRQLPVGRHWSCSTATNIEPTELPWYYAPWWVLISTPPVVLVGAVLSAVVCSRAARTRCAGSRSGSIVAVSPGQRRSSCDSTLYDGIRHLLFIYPVLVVLAVAGWTGLLSLDPVPPGSAPGAATVSGGGARERAGVRHPLPSEPGRVFQCAGRRAARRVRAATTWTTGATACCRRWSGRSNTARSSGTPDHDLGQPSASGPTRLRSVSSEVSFTSPPRNRHYLQIQLARGPVEALQETGAATSAAPGAHARWRGAVHGHARARLR